MQGEGNRSAALRRIRAITGGGGMVLLLLLDGCDRKPAGAPAGHAPIAAAPGDSAPPAPAAPSAPADTGTPAPSPAPQAPAPKQAPAPSPVPAPKQAQAPSPPAPLHDVYHPQPRDTISQAAYQGWKQFELNCARCHGEYGVGSSFAPALVVSLKEGGTIPTKELFVQTVCAGRLDKGMPSWCALGLEMDKIDNMYAYLKGRADGKIGAGRPAVRAE